MINFVKEHFFKIIPFIIVLTVFIFSIWNDYLEQQKLKIKPKIGAEYIVLKEKKS